MTKSERKEQVLSFQILSYNPELIAWETQDKQKVYCLNIVPTHCDKFVLVTEQTKPQTVQTKETLHKLKSKHLGKTENENN